MARRTEDVLVQAGITKEYPQSTRELRLVAHGILRTDYPSARLVRALPNIVAISDPDGVVDTDKLERKMLKTFGPNVGLTVTRTKMPLPA